MHSYCEALSKYLLFTTNLTRVNMPTAQQKKRAQIGTTEIFFLQCYSENLVFFSRF